MGYLTGYLAFMVGIFLFLYWLLQPVRIVNAGQSVYIPPPQTRLIPLPRKMDAPELMETAELASSPLAALAEATVPSNSESGRPTRKRHRAETREARRAYVVERSAYYRSYDRYWQRSYRGW